MDRISSRRLNGNINILIQNLIRENLIIAKGSVIFLKLYLELTPGNKDSQMILHMEVGICAGKIMKQK